MRSNQLLLFFLATLSSCSGGGGGGGASDVARERPLQFEPSEPGLLTIGPPGLALEVGGLRTLEVELYDSLGVLEVPPEVTWISEDPDRVAIDLDGTIQSLSLGRATVTAVDSGGRVASLAVEVVQPGAFPVGPVAIRFEPPVLNLTVGESRLPSFVLTDAAGLPASTNLDVRLLAQGGTVEVEPNTNQLSGIAEGISVVSGVLVDEEGAETSLEGQLLVLVLDPNAPIGQGSCEWIPTSGIFLRPPIFFSKPGVTSELRVLAYERKYCTAGISGAELRVRQVPPDFVTIADANVLSINSVGLLQSQHAGQTDIAGLLVREDGSELPVPPFRGSVLPDMGGVWSLTAPNGDTGQLSFPGVAPFAVDPETGAVIGGLMTPRVRLAGESTLNAANGARICRDLARFNGSFLTVAGNGTCSETRPGRLGVLSVELISYCGDERHPERFEGPDSVIEWDCIGADRIRGSNGVILTRGTPGFTESASVDVDGSPLQDPDPTAVLSSTGELFVTFFDGGDNDAFGVALSLRGITQPGRYTLSNVGGFDFGDTNFVAYGRFDPLVVYTTGPDHQVTLDVERVDDVLQATFSGVLMDLDVEGSGPGPDVTLANGRVSVAIETQESGAASFLLDGSTIRDPEPYAELEDGELYIALHEDGSFELDRWSFEIDLSGVTGPGTYFATSRERPNTALLERGGTSESYERYSTDFEHMVRVEILELDSQRIRGEFSGSVTTDFSVEDGSHQLTGGSFEAFF